MTTQPSPYDPNIPQQPSDPLAISQPEIKNNFQQLYNIFEKNHVPLDSLVNPGNHTNIQLKEQGNSQQTDPSVINIYVKDDPNTTDQIFLRYQGNGQEFQLSCYQIYSLTQFAGVFNPFITFLPGRVLVYFGFINAPAKSNTLELYPPIAKNIISVSLCPLTVTTTLAYFKPWISLIKNSNNFYDKIKFNSPGTVAGLSGGPIPVPQLYYMVLANI